jgi:hypothetical protein
MWLHDVVYQFASPSKGGQNFVAGSKKFDIKGEADVREINHAVGWRALKGLAWRILESSPVQAKGVDQTNKTRYCSQHVMTNSASKIKYMRSFRENKLIFGCTESERSE